MSQLCMLRRCCDMTDRERCVCCKEAGTAEGPDELAEMTRSSVQAGLVTPPPAAQPNVSPQGPTTRSKSARKVSCERRLSSKLSHAQCRLLAALGQSAGPCMLGCASYTEAAQLRNRCCAYQMYLCSGSACDATLIWSALHVLSSVRHAAQAFAPLIVGSVNTCPTEDRSKAHANS